MAKITLEIPDELLEQLNSVGARLPELLSLSLQQPALGAHIYRYILEFLASGPTREEILAFSPTPEMSQRLKILLGRSKTGELTPAEQRELDEYERIEHLTVMLKAGSLGHLSRSL